jgi:hypothetical protein
MSNNGASTKTHPVVVAKELQEEAPLARGAHEAPTMGCGILGKYPVIAVLTFALIGVAAGVGFSFWEPDDMEKKEKALKWVR